MKIVLVSVILSMVLCGCMTQPKLEATKPWEDHYYTVEELRKIIDTIQLDKNESIRHAMKLTHDKRKNQICKVYRVKIDQSALNTIQKEQLIRMFLEAKWLYNDILNWSNLSQDNSPFNYVISNKVQVKLPNGSFEERELTAIHSQMKQEVQHQICNSIKTLAKLKKKGLQNCGKLKFKSEVTKVHIKQLPKNFIRRGKHFVKIPNIKGEVRVNGLKQIPDGVDFACTELLNTPKGYYLTITTYINKDQIVKKSLIEDTLGIDFGCQTNFTTSDGEKINCIVEESERLKRLQKHLARQVKGSNNYKRTVHLIRIEYQKLSDKKNDLANKVVHKFSQYETAVIQDEQLHTWHKSNHGKAIQHSIMGTVKSKLSQKENVIVLSKWLPTTKLCTNCGKIHDEIRLYDRIFRCDCGVSEDRDIHSAKTMIWLNNNVDVGRTDIKRVELESLLDTIFSKEQILTVKHEATIL